jgi:hypothetical protein
MTTNKARLVESSSMDRATLSRWNRLVFRFFGPASVGRLDAPVQHDDPDPRCPHCGFSESEHVSYVSADGNHLRQCPALRGAA